jgi:LmbE family N-acetylglucosaminyl deacetylase
MLEFLIDNKSIKRPKILLLGAHCDDIEIGCGGTILNILEKNRNVEIHWVVFSSDPSRRKEARSSANLFMDRAVRKKIAINNFRNGYFPYIGGEIKEYFENIKEKLTPDIIFTHNRNDLHQDHRTISELTWNTFRNHLILEYEISKYDGDFGTPNCFVRLNETIRNKKVSNILASFKTQSDKHWFKKELFLSVMRIRGMECCSDTGYAEAFYCRKILLDVKL